MGKQLPLQVCWHKRCCSVMTAHLTFFALSLVICRVRIMPVNMLRADSADGRFLVVSCSFSLFHSVMFTGHVCVPVCQHRLVSTHLFCLCSSQLPWFFSRAPCLCLAPYLERDMHKIVWHPATSLLCHLSRVPFMYCIQLGWCQACHTGNCRDCWYCVLLVLSWYVQHGRNHYYHYCRL